MSTENETPGGTGASGTCRHNKQKAPRSLAEWLICLGSYDTIHGTQPSPKKLKVYTDKVKEQMNKSQKTKQESELDSYTVQV